MLTLDEKGLFCAAGGFHIDPMRVVDVALITHAHSDHARRGSRHYYCERSGAALLARRIGADARITTVEYGERLRFGQTTVSFHPAGHILGSAQIRVELDSGAEHARSVRSNREPQAPEVWVASGDYKREPDPSCPPFEVVKCDVFVTEATFGDPKYKWDTDGVDQGREILDWWKHNRSLGRNSLLFAYALGKTQRILAELARHTDERVHVFGEAHDLTELYRAERIRLVPTERLEDLGPRRRLRGALVVAPHSIASSPWLERLSDPSTAFASGWMKSGAWGMGRRYERGFIMSDHSDWPALLRTIEETGAKNIYVLHGGEGKLTRHLRAKGYRAQPMLKPTRPARPGEMKTLLKGEQGSLFR